MNSLELAAKASKQFGKIMKSTVNPKEVGVISDAAKQAGLDAIKTRNIFSNGMTRKEYVDNIHNTINTVKPGSNMKPETVTKLEDLLGSLHPNVRNSLFNADKIQTAKKIANIIENNPTLSATDVGHVLNKHLNKAHTVGKFSHRYLTHIVNTPTAERAQLHSAVNVLTSVKKEKIRNSKKQLIKVIESPNITAKQLKKLFPAVKTVATSKSATKFSRRHSVNPTEWHKSQAIDLYVTEIRKYARRLKDDTSRGVFWNAINAELKNPTGKNIAGIFKEVKGGVNG